MPAWFLKHHSSDHFSGSYIFFGRVYASVSAYVQTVSF